jgi:predicted aspartyl protease
VNGYYLATVMWNEEEREVLVLQAEGGPLIGMSLLYGYRVILNVVENGDVIIDTLP